MDTSGFIYVLQMEGHPYYKIGRTNNIDRRIKEISPVLPTKHRLVRYYSVKDAVRGEKTLHNEFKAQRLNGEWFNLTASDLDYIHCVCLLGQSIKLFNKLVDRIQNSPPETPVLITGKVASALSRAAIRVQRRYDWYQDFTTARDVAKLDAILDSEYVG